LAIGSRDVNREVRSKNDKSISFCTKKSYKKYIFLLLVATLRLFTLQRFKCGKKVEREGHNRRLQLSQLNQVNDKEIAFSVSWREGEVIAKVSVCLFGGLKYSCTELFTVRQMPEDESQVMHQNVPFVDYLQAV
jgi:hypothetical protein